MAGIASAASSVTFSPLRTHERTPSLSVPCLKPQPRSIIRPSNAFPRFTSSVGRFSLQKFTASNGALDDVENGENEDVLLSFDVEQGRPIRFVFWVLVWASVSLVFRAAFGGKAHAAAADSIRASSFGLKVASALRGSGWPDEAIVFALATLPVVELRGAIPVGYWLQLKPMALTILSVLGNMVPVPFIVLYLKRFA